MQQLLSKTAVSVDKPDSKHSIAVRDCTRNSMYIAFCAVFLRPAHDYMQNSTILWH